MRKVDPQLSGLFYPAAQIIRIGNDYSILEMCILLEYLNFIQYVTEGPVLMYGLQLSELFS